MMLKATTILAVLAVGWTSHATAQETRKKYERNLITREEIRDRAPDVLTAYEVIQRLRPHFLREKATGAITTPFNQKGDRNPAASKTPIQVYINGAKAGIAAVSLREIQAEAVVDILYLNSSDATTRFGTGHDQGAILVVTGR
jgi:hypothetical protein